ncbi:Homeobox protein aristaless-like 4 [Branchiostoma belcheri]|nr:Homeobox protein aristaless-like 4 [Branchiostoma belcheri]
MAYQAGQGFGRPEGEDAYGPASLLAMPGPAGSGSPPAPRQHSIAGILGAASPLDTAAKVRDRVHTLEPRSHGPVTLHTLTRGKHRGACRFVTRSEGQVLSGRPVAWQPGHHRLH